MASAVESEFRSCGEQARQRVAVDGRLGEDAIPGLRVGGERHDVHAESIERDWCAPGHLTSGRHLRRGEDVGDRGGHHSSVVAGAL